MPYKSINALSLVALLLLSQAAQAASDLSAAAQAQLDSNAKAVFKGQVMPPDVRAMCTQELRRERERKTLKFDAYKEFGASCMYPGMEQLLLDEVVLNEKERKDPAIIANVKAVDEVLTYITFAVKTDNGDFIGYWQWPKGTSISEARIVSFDTEGQFKLLDGRTITEVLLLYWANPDNEGNTPKKYQRARKNLEELGSGPIPATYQLLYEQPLKRVQMTPEKLHEVLFERYLREALGKK